MRTPLRVIAPTPDEVQQARAEQARIVLLSSAKNLGTGIIAAFIMALSAWWTAAEGWSRWSPWVWWGLLTFGLVRGVRISWKFRNSNQSDDEARRMAPILRINATYCAACWGLASWLMLPNQNLHAEAFLVVATAMVFMGGAASQAVSRPVLFAFLLPATAVFSSGLFRLGDFFHILLGIAFPLLAYVIVSAARNQQDAVETATVLRIRSVRLAAEKSEQKVLAERVRGHVEVLLAEKIEQQNRADSARLEAELARENAVRQQSLADSARQEAEQAREEAERANQGKTAFLTAASHDLRQPMHALVQYFGHLQRRNRDASLTETLERSSKALDAMQDLLDSILEVSKLMMGGIRPRIGPLSIQSVLERLDAQLRPLAESKGLSFVMQDDNTWVNTDEVLLERILRNIVINAIRYTSGGEVHVQCCLESDKLVVRVADTGIGIKEENLERIFEEFFQVENDARDRRKGLGLGLSIVRQLCALLDLKVMVESTYGVGSIFSVYVPISEKALARHRAVAAGHDYVKGSFVLLIEDDEASLRATSETLKELGCRVLAVGSGMEAIEKLQGQEFAPQLVLSDYRLEYGQTGIDAIRMVYDNQRALYGDEFLLAALVISGDTAPEELLNVQRAGYQMLHKPVKVEILHRAMNNELRELALNVNSGSV